ncbi:universal stress protein [Streptomyces sp. NPDC056160]|uniref:universal stress protein n=1 Tax=Streptomyces sp. NPDC056160 TaxID=3345731 RepID=UPI0035DAD30E
MRTVVAGIDGSPESRAAADWAAREAGLLGAPLRLVHVWQPLEQAPLPGMDTLQDQAGQMLRDVGGDVRRRHPHIEVSVAHLPGRPAAVLCQTANEAELLVLGSRALGGVGGFLVGSVGLSVAAHAERPVVLVRADRHLVDGDHEESSGYRPSVRDAHCRPVVLGLDTAAPDDGLIEFAFRAAERRTTSLRVVHGWYPPPYFGPTPAADAELHASAARSATAVLTEVLHPWRHKHPNTEVVEDSRFGNAAQLLVGASRGASLVVVGRRLRRGPLGTHIGPVAHGVLHHATAPVAVVAHP